MPARLEGKVCVITSTDGSMGSATALAFAREGASVVACDATVEPAESTVEIVRGAGGDMVSMQPCHLDDPADCQALIELALGTYGMVDVLAMEGREHGIRGGAMQQLGAPLCAGRARRPTGSKDATVASV